LWIDLAGEGRHPPFTEEVRRSLQPLADTFAEVGPRTVEEWEAILRCEEKWEKDLCLLLILVEWSLEAAGPAAPDYEQRASRRAALDFWKSYYSWCAETLTAKLAETLTAKLAETLTDTLRDRTPDPLENPASDLMKICNDWDNEDHSKVFVERFKRLFYINLFDETRAQFSASLADLVMPDAAEQHPILHIADVIWAVSERSGRKLLGLVRAPQKGGTEGGNARPLRILKVKVNPKGSDVKHLLGMAAKLEGTEGFFVFRIRKTIDPSRVMAGDAAPHHEPGRAVVVERLLRAHGPGLPVVGMPDEDGRREVLHGSDQLEAARSAGKKACRAYVLEGRCHEVMD
jgi:hypothetical protein